MVKQLTNVQDDTDKLAAGGGLMPGGRSVLFLTLVAFVRAYLAKDLAVLRSCLQRCVAWSRKDVIPFLKGSLTPADAHVSLPVD